MSIFVSYSRQDFPYASGLYQDLKAAGLEPWLDIVNIPSGSIWQEEVRLAIEHCSAFVLVATPASLRSYSVREEWRLALELGSDLVHVAVEPVEDALEAFEDRVFGRGVPGEILADEGLEGILVSVLRAPEGGDLLQAAPRAGALPLAVSRGELGFELGDRGRHPRRSLGPRPSRREPARAEGDERGRHAADSLRALSPSPTKPSARDRWFSARLIDSALRRDL